MGITMDYWGFLAGAFLPIIHIWNYRDFDTVFRRV
jgi:hypothetical protein